MLYLWPSRRVLSPAQERGEPVGGVVGYSVRLDTKRSARTRLLFCTTGAAASAQPQNNTD